MEVYGPVYLPPQTAEKAEEKEEAERSFLKKHGVKDGRWLMNAKDDWELLMRPGFEPIVKLYAFVQLHTKGYQSELVVKQVEGRIVPLTPFAVRVDMQRYQLLEVKKSGKSPSVLVTAEGIDALKQKLKRKPTQVELDEAGRQTCLLDAVEMRRYLERAEDEDGFLTRVRAERSPMLLPKSFNEAIQKRRATPLSAITDPLLLKKLNGKCFIYGHVIARAASVKVFLRQAFLTDKEAAKSKQKAKAKHDHPSAQGSFDFMQDTEFSTAYTKANEKAPDKAAEVMSDIEREMEEVRRKGTARLLEIAQEPEQTSKGSLPAKPDKEQKASALNSNGNHSKMSPTISSARVEGEGVAARAENTSASLNPNRKEESTTRTFPTTPTGRDAESSLVSQPRPRVSDPEAYQVLDALEKYCNATLEDAAMLIARCRQSRAVTVSQVVQAVELKGKAAKHKDSPIAYIMFWAPRLFQSTPERKPVESQSEPNMALIRSLYEKGTAEDRMTLLAEYPELAPATAAHGD